MGYVTLPQFMTSFLAAGAGLMPAGTAAQAADAAASIEDAEAAEVFQRGAELEGIAFTQFACPLMSNPAVRLFKPPEDPHQEPTSETGVDGVKHRKRQLPEWGETPDRLQEALVHIVETQLGGDASRVNGGKKFRRAAYSLPSGEEISGTRLIDTAARLECPGKSIRTALKMLGGRSGIVRIIREKYLSEELEPDKWCTCYNRFRNVLSFIVENHFGGDASKLTNARLKGKRFTLPDGTDVGYAKLLFAAARLELPGMNVKDAVQTLGGEAAVYKIIREKYLFRMDEREDGPVRANEFILHYLMDGDEGIFFEKKFMDKLFLFPDGSSLTGRELMDWAREIFGWSDHEDAVVMRNLISMVADTRALPDWGATPQRMTRVLVHILENDFGGDIEKISTGIGKLKLTLPSGDEIDGKEIIKAIARLEVPGESAFQAVKILGGQTAVTDIMRRKYLSGRDWRGTPGDVRSALLEIVENYFEGDPNLVHTGRGFERRTFELSSGQRITGSQIIHTVAKLERPGMMVREAIKDIGGRAEVARVIREEYLSDMYENQAWADTPDKVAEAVRFVVDHYFDGDGTRIKSYVLVSSRKFVLPTGQEISGYQLLNAVAHAEKPDLVPENAVKAIGTWGDVARIAREKYLFRLEDTRQSLVRAMRYILKYILDGDRDAVLSRSFSTLVLSFVDGSELRGSELVQRARVAFGWYGMEGDLVLQRLMEMADIELQDNEASIRKVLGYIAGHFFDSSGSAILEYFQRFRKSNYELPDGSQISGTRIIYSVAAAEFPGKGKVAAMKELGGLGAASRIMREKYLFSLDDTPESFVHAMRLIMGDEGDRGDEDEDS